jgi:hypothetical protein
MIKILLFAIFSVQFLGAVNGADTSVVVPQSGKSMRSSALRSGGEIIPAGDNRITASGASVASTADGAEVANPYAVLFEGFNSVLSGRVIAPDQGQKIQRALSELGMIGAAEFREPGYKSKGFLCELFGSGSDGFASYQFEEIIKRAAKREFFKNGIVKPYNMNQEIFLKLLSVDQVQDEGDKNKLIDYLRMFYFHKNDKFQGVKEFYKLILQEDIFLRLSVVFNKIEVRSNREKLLVVSTAAIKCCSGLASFVTGALFLATSGASYCPGAEVPYALNTTLAQIPAGFAAITNVPETIVNSSVYPGHIGVSPLVNCGTSNNVKLLTGVGAIIASGFLIYSGVTDLFLNPMAATDLRSLITGRRVHPNIDVIQGVILERVIGIGDRAIQEQLIATALNLVERLLPGGACQDITTVVGRKMDELTSISYKKLV